MDSNWQLQRQSCRAASVYGARSGVSAYTFPFIISLLLKNLNISCSTLATFLHTHRPCGTFFAIPTKKCSYPSQKTILFSQIKGGGGVAWVGILPRGAKSALCFSIKTWALPSPSIRLSQIHRRRKDIFCRFSATFGRKCSGFVLCGLTFLENYVIFSLRKRYF